MLQFKEKLRKCKVIINALDILWKRMLCIVETTSVFAVWENTSYMAKALRAQTRSFTRGTKAEPTKEEIKDI